MDVLSSPTAAMPSDTATADERRWLLALLLLAIAARVATLSAYPLMDNTEARYAEIARKMVETGDWVMPQFEYGVPFWSKPPLSIWLTSLSYVAFGVGEFSARLPSLLTCLIAAWLTYRLSYLRGETTIPWMVLQHQFGSEYHRLRDFKAAFLEHLKTVLTVYRDAKAEPAEGGLLLRPSPPHVRRLSR